jgi:hypothetical protein
MPLLSSVHACTPSKMILLLASYEDVHLQVLLLLMAAIRMSTFKLTWFEGLQKAPYANHQCSNCSAHTSRHGTPATVADCDSSYTSLLLHAQRPRRPLVLPALKMSSQQQHRQHCSGRAVTRPYPHFAASEAACSTCTAVENAITPAAILHQS